MKEEIKYIDGYPIKPCIGCSYCCSQAVCIVGQRHYEIGPKNGEE